MYSHKATQGKKCTCIPDTYKCNEYIACHSFSLCENNIQKKKIIVKYNCNVNMVLCSSTCTVYFCISQSLYWHVRK